MALGEIVWQPVRILVDEKVRKTRAVYWIMEIRNQNGIKGEGESHGDSSTRYKF